MKSIIVFSPNYFLRVIRDSMLAILFKCFFFFYNYALYDMCHSKSRVVFQDIPAFAVLDKLMNIFEIVVSAKFFFPYLENPICLFSMIFCLSCV